MLTDAKVRTAKPRAKPYKLTDSNRLFLLVAPSGGKLWRWNYAYDGRQKSMAFGSYPLVSLNDARAKRDEAYTILCEGRDPAIAKKLKIEANLEASRQTFERVARRWHENAKSQWAKRHVNDVMRSLERDVFPSIGTLPIADITPPLILAVLREIEARGSIETARRVLQRITAVFGFAIAEGLVKTDPSERLDAALKPLRRGRQPAILKLAPLKEMILAAEEENARPITRLALRFLALTAVRPSELRGARWDEFENLNGDEPLWRIPTARMKGDLARKEEVGGDHLVPLTSQAIAVLKAVWPLTGEGVLVFPSARHMHQPMSENALGYLLNRAGYHGHHVPHGFRAAWPLLQQLANMTGFVSFFDNYLTIAVLLLAWAIVILAFFILAVQMFVTIIEFKLTSLAGFVLVPFALWNRTSFLAERVLGNVVSSGIKVMVLAVIVGIGSNFFTEFTTSMQGQEVDLAAAMSLALGALTLFGLGIFGPGIASGLVSGAPQLGAGAALGTVAGAAGVTMLAGGAAVGAAGAVGGAALGAVRAGTSMGSAASTAYTLGKETAASPTVGAGLGGVARAAGNAARMRMSSALGLGDAARNGRQAAWNALNETSKPASDGAGAADPPAWAQSLRAQQSARHHQQVAVHALQQGDRGGASATPDIKERDE